MSFLASKAKIKTIIPIPSKHKYQPSKSIAKASKIKFALKIFLNSCLVIFKHFFVCNKFIDFKFCHFSPPDRPNRAKSP